MGFALSKVAENGTLVLTPRGEMDVHTAPELGRIATEAMQQTAPVVVIDLSQLSFMDCSGVTVLLTIRREVLSRGGRVSLEGASAGVEKLLRLTGVNRLFAADLEVAPQIVLPEPATAVPPKEELRS